MKKIISAILTLTLFIGVLACGTSAQASTIQPLLNNTSSTCTNFVINDSTGKATVTISCTGDSHFTRVNVVTYIEKKTLGIFWKRVEIGTENNEWKDSSNKNPYNTTRSTTLKSKGTYRAVVTYTVLGTGGDPDVITSRVEHTYN